MYYPMIIKKKVSSLYIQIGNSGASPNEGELKKIAGSFRRKSEVTGEKMLSMKLDS